MSDRVSELAVSEARSADPDTLAELEEERAFLLRSLQDLERERSAGDIDEADYQVLHDDYTARAAAVLRSIKERRVVISPPRRRRPGRVVATVLAVVLLGALAGELLARFSGERLEGQSASGSVRPANRDKLSQAIGLFQSGKPVEALKLLDEVLKQDPRNPEALAYRGWLLRLAGRQSGNASLVDEAFRWVERAVASDPTYADAHFFKGLMLLQDRQDPKGAVTELKAFLAANPAPERVKPVEEMLRAAQAAAEGRAPTVVPSAPPQSSPAPQPSKR